MAIQMKKQSKKELEFNIVVIQKVYFEFCYL